MVTTLIKHEVLRTRTFLAIVFGAATLLTLVGWLMAYTPWSVVQILGIVVMFATVSVFILVLQLALAYDYWRSSYTKTGYFTQSLPAKGSTIYGAKLLWGGLVVVVGTIWNLVLLIPVVMGIAHTQGETVTFANLRELLSFAWAAAPAWAWLVLGVLFLITIVGSLATYYFAASVGSEAWINKLGIGGPIIVAFAAYTILQILLFLGILAVPLGLAGNGDGTLSLTSVNFYEMFVAEGNDNVMPLGFFPVFLIAMAVMVWRTVVSWNKKVSLV